MTTTNKIVKAFDKAFNMIVGAQHMYSYQKGNGYSVTVCYQVFGRTVFTEKHMLKDFLDVK